MQNNNENGLDNLIRRPIGGFAYIIAKKDDRIAGIDDKVKFENNAKTSEEYPNRKSLINNKKNVNRN